MIAALILIAVTGWNCWLMHRAGRCPPGNDSARHAGPAD